MHETLDYDKREGVSQQVGLEREKDPADRKGQRVVREESQKGFKGQCCGNMRDRRD